MFKQTMIATLVAASIGFSANAAWAVPHQPSDWALANIDKTTLKSLKRQYGVGPYPQEIDAFLVDKPESLRPLYRSLFVEGTRNATLNLLRIALAAVELGDYARAEETLDAALARIETVYADDPRAAKARSLWAKESVKDWKGEPYERAMAYYYRGLLYLREGDFENARASFRQAEFQDTVAEQEEFSSDFALMNYMAGWASHCARDTASADELFAIARQHNPALAPPEAHANVLLISELGGSPRKRAEGEHNELLVIEGSADPGPASVSFALGAGMQPIAAVEASSVTFQATTRGGRAVQSILDGKARFKDTAETVGEVAQGAGMAAMYMGATGNHSDLAAAGALFAVGGMLASAVAEAAKPDADTRYWDNLPSSVVLAATTSATSVSVSVAYDGEQRPAVALTPSGASCTVVWSRSHSALAIDGTAPGAQLSGREAKKLQKLFGDADRAFRAELISANF